MSAQLERIGVELLTSSPPSTTDPNISRLVDRARGELNRLSDPATSEESKLSAWRADMRDLLGRIDDNLRELRRETSLGPQAS